MVYNKANKRTQARTEMERHLFEQYEKTTKHRNHGRQLRQTTLMKYTTNSPGIQYSDLSISVRIQAAQQLAKEDVAILKFSSLVKSKLTSNRYSSFFYKLFSFTNVIIVYILKGILTKMLAGILLIHVIGNIALFRNYGG